MTSISGPGKIGEKKGNFLKTLFEGNCRIPHSKLPRASYFSTSTSIALITNKRCFKRAQLHRCIWPLSHSLSSSTATHKGRINDELAVVVGLLLQFGGKLLWVDLIQPIEAVTVFPQHPKLSLHMWNIAPGKKRRKWRSRSPSLTGGQCFSAGSSVPVRTSPESPPCSQPWPACPQRSVSPTRQGCGRNCWMRDSSCWAARVLPVRPEASRGGSHPKTASAG